MEVSFEGPLPEDHPLFSGGLALVSGSKRTLIMLAGRKQAREMYEAGALTDADLEEAGLAVEWLYRPSLQARLDEADTTDY